MGIIEDQLEFCNSVEQKKYYSDGETSWDEVAKRLTSGLEKSMQKAYGTVYQDKKDAFYQYVKSKFITPGGSIISKLGRESHTPKASYSNCYHISIESDTIEAIFKTLGEMARTFSYRGGCGTSISILRPTGALVDNAAGSSSGAVSFLPLFSENVHSIGQKGRRAAAIIDIDVWHPDVENVIMCKSKPDQVFGIDLMSTRKPDVSGANITVKLSDAFMNAVVNDEDFDLIFPDIEYNKPFYNEKWKGNIEDWKSIGGKVKVYKTVKARYLFDLISENAWAIGDPGVAYWDNVIKNSPSSFDEKTKAVGFNPCGEQILSNYSNCLLSAIVMWRLVDNPWSVNAEIDINKLREIVRTQVYMLDAIIDTNTHPLEKQKETDLYSRRIGIELTGLADALAMMNIKYGSEDSFKFMDYIMNIIQSEAIKTSINIARNHGSCPALDNKEKRKAFTDQPYFQKLIKKNPSIWLSIVADIIEYGCRNTAWTTMGPCGSISIINNNCTSGIEPLFRLFYERASRVATEGEFIKIYHLPILLEAQKRGLDLTDMTKEEILTKFSYVESDNITVEERVKFQSVIQTYVDTSISSTINLTNGSSVEDIKNAYMLGWKYDLKGITVFRDGCMRGVFSTDETQKTTKKEEEFDILYERNLRDVEDAKRYKVNWKGVPIYLTVVHDDEGNPLEIFAQLPFEAGINGNGDFTQSLFMERLSHWHTICRLSSTILRYGVSVEELVKQLDKSSFNIFDLSNIIKRIIKQYPISLYDDDIEYDDETPKEIEMVTTPKTDKKVKCKKCASTNVRMVNGCPMCLDCGEYKCD